MMLPIDASELIPMSASDFAAIRRRLFDPEITPAKLRAKAAAAAAARAREKAIDDAIKAAEARAAVEAVAAAERAARSTAEAARLDALLAQLQKPAIVVPPPLRRSLWIREIVAQVALKHSVTVDQILGPSRVHSLVRARQEAMWRLRHERSMSFPEIGRRLQGRDHSTAIHGVRKHQARLDAEGSA